MSDEKIAGLWRNCSDSLRHALHHFSEAREYADDFHNHKWALLSVAHAAEVYFNLLLTVFNPKHPDKRKNRYPSLEEARSPGQCVVLSA